MSDINSDEEYFYDQDEIILDNDVYTKSTYNPDKNITKNKLSKYERTSIIIMRSEQINNGSNPFIDDYEKFDTIEDIVKEELKQNKIPFIIKRNIINDTEYWKLSDLN